MFDLTHEQRDLQARARAFAEEVARPQAAATDASESYPWPVVGALKDAGFFGLTVPEAYGGAGRSYLDAVLVVEEMARACGVTGRIVIETNMGAVSAIMAYGSEAQKRLAGDLVRAGDKPAICITEPDAGSAATEMTTTAVRHGDDYVINGMKHWITGGGVSVLHLIFARVIEDGEAQGIAAFIALRDQDAGLRIGKRVPTMGLRGIPETEVHFEDLKLPVSRMVVPPQGMARGFAGLMDAYNSQRVGAATMPLGIAAGAYDLARAFVLEREQFGRPIAEFQGLQWMLADMATALDAARLMIWRAAASAPPGGFPDPQYAAQAKVLAAETGVRVTNDALQLHGAAGYSRELPLERMVRDARMFTIGGGTAQVLRTLVAGEILGRRFPQTRGGASRAASGAATAVVPRDTEALPAAAE